MRVVPGPFPFTCMSSFDDTAGGQGNDVTDGSFPTLGWPGATFGQAASPPLADIGRTRAARPRSVSVIKSARRRDDPCSGGRLRGGGRPIDGSLEVVG
jgi:hypothetical protein